MTTEANKQLAKTFMQFVSDGEMERATECLQEDMEWKIVSISRPGVYTRTQVMNATRAMVAASTDGKFRLSPIGMIAEGDKVAIEAESLVNLKDGRVYNNKYHMLFTIRAGRVVECREYNDTAHTIEILSSILAGITIPSYLELIPTTDP
jgi:ketosteroid isomerase-like protein